jgi:small-conductance mechanosensitive channel
VDRLRSVLHDAREQRRLSTLLRGIGFYVLATLIALVILTISRSIISAVPGLVFIVIIVLITRGLVRLVKALFDAVGDGRISVPGLFVDTAPVTHRVVVAVLWIFALVMAYPYIPGSQSEAFKGMSVFIGLLVSLGASGVVNQAASGIILMYSRAFKPGDYVRVADTEGEVISMHYERDPESAKVVPPDKWHTPPAPPAEG